MLLKNFLEGATLGDLDGIYKAGPMPKATVTADDNGIRRVSWYLGPDEEIKVEALETYEKRGGYIIEPKWDGMWAMLTVGAPKAGRPHTLKSRDAKTGLVGGSNTGDILDLNINRPEGTILVGELEAASEWATKQVQARGYRRLHLFDYPKNCEDLRQKTWTERRKMLEEVVSGFDSHVTSRLPLVPYFTDNFRARYEAWVAEGIEGCVLKLASSKYETPRLDGKTDLWLRCKNHVAEDYVLFGLGKTPGGTVTGLWGMFKDGKLTYVMRARAPANLLQEKYVGKVVCEFHGWAKFDSGALRHAQFARTRPDKTPEMCVLKGG